jgi:protein SCO1/2
VARCALRAGAARRRARGLRSSTRPRARSRRSSFRAPTAARLTNADLKGAWSLLFFGYTHCPDVCPTTLATLKQVEAQLAGTPVKVIFVSVDPERDTPQALSEYVGYFSKAFVAATADTPTLQALASAVGVVFVKSPQAGSDYNVDHTASLLVVDPHGRLHALFRPPFDAAAIASDLRMLAKEESR